MEIQGKASRAEAQTKARLESLKNRVQAAARSANTKGKEHFTLEGRILLQVLELKGLQQGSKPITAEEKVLMLQSREQAIAGGFRNLTVESLWRVADNRLGRLRYQIGLKSKH